MTSSTHRDFWVNPRQAEVDRIWAALKAAARKASACTPAAVRRSAETDRTTGES